MQVTADRDFWATRDSQVLSFEKGQIIEGDLARYLLMSGAPVTESPSEDTDTAPQGGVSADIAPHVAPGTFSTGESLPAPGVASGLDRPRQGLPKMPPPLPEAGDQAGTPPDPDGDGSTKSDSDQPGAAIGSTAGRASSTSGGKGTTSTRRGGKPTSN